MASELDMVKILINSILTASQNAMSIGQLEAEYKQMENEFIPFEKFGYSSLLEFLTACSDKVRIVRSGGSEMVLPVVAEETKHIHELVQNQKKDHSKKVGFRIHRDVERKILRLLANSADGKIPVANLLPTYMKAYRTPLPCPKGKMVAWLSTSNQFAITTSDKNLKVIEPLSNVDISSYRDPQEPSKNDKLKESVMNALKSFNPNSNKVPTAPQPAQPAQPAPPAPPPSSIGVPTSACVTRQTSIFGQAKSNSTASNLELSTRCANWSTFGTASNPTTASTKSDNNNNRLCFEASACTTANTPTDKRQMDSNAATSDSTTTHQLTAEVRQFLVDTIMKNTAGTPISELSKQYNLVKPAVSSATLVRWLRSMNECLLIGTEDGKVILKPGFRRSNDASRLGSRFGLASNSSVTPNCSRLLPSRSSALVNLTSHAGRVPEAGQTNHTLNKSAINESMSSSNETYRVTKQATNCSTNTENRCLNGRERSGVAQSCSGSESTRTTSASVAFNAYPVNSTKPVMPSAGSTSSAERNQPVVIPQRRYGGLSITDLIELTRLMWRKPKVPIDLIVAELEEQLLRPFKPPEEIVDVVDYLSGFGLVKVDPNSDVSLFAPVQLKNFTYTGVQWADVTDNDAFWKEFMTGDCSSAQGVCMTGKVIAINDKGYTFLPNWSPPRSCYQKATVAVKGCYTYICDNVKLRAEVHHEISNAGKQYIVYFPDSGRFKPCHQNQLFVGPPQPVIKVVPIGRCPAVNDEIKLKIAFMSHSVTFGCVDHEEVCGTVTSLNDPNFSFRLLHWANQSYIPREDLARLAMDKRLTAMDPSAIMAGEYFENGFWMKNIHEKLFVPVHEFVELLDTEGFPEDVICDLLLL